MQVGKKGTGQEAISKMVVSHHGRRMRHGKGRRVEKAIETRVRRAGKAQIQEES